MRSLRSGLLGCVVACVLGTAAVVGCAATGDTGDVGEPTTSASPTEADKETVIPPKSNGEDDEDQGATSAGTDAGKSDGGSKDAGKDAAKDSGPPAPAPGSSCATVDQVFKRTCGKCGWQEAICKQGGVVSDYGVCQGEIGSCEPGATQACGNCGTQTCSNSCNWNACTGQPANACSPGSVQFSTAGCTTPNTYIQKTCSGTCTWGPFDAVCKSPSLTVAAVGQVASGTWSLSASKVGKRPSGTTCPATSVYFTDVAYFAVPVTNNTTKTATVQIYNSGAASLDTFLSVYSGSSLPTTDAAIKACVKAADGCSSVSPDCGGTSLDWAGIDNVTIPAGGTVMVVTSGYNDTEVGDFNLNVKTKSLN